MGLFDKIKQAGRMLTGGGAKVHVEVGEAQLGVPIALKVSTVVSDADLSINAVYVNVRGEEVVEIEAGDLRKKLSHLASDLAADGRIDGVVFREATFETRVNLSGPATLEAGSEHEWEGEFELPPGCLPTFAGRRCKHRWRVFAGLDATGNDPDSGWVDFQVKA